MNYFDFKILVRRNIGGLVLMSLLGASIAFFVLMFTTPHYKTSSKFLVVQSSGNTEDFYTQFKSSEYLSKVLSEAIHSESYINAVVGTGKISNSSLPLDKKTKLKEWQKHVTVKKNLELGVIEIAVEGDNQKEINSTMEGITEVLVNQNTLFRGGDPNSVQIKTLSGPITEKVPSIALIIKTLIAGLISGFFVTLLVLLMKHGQKSTLEKMLHI